MAVIAFLVQNTTIGCVFGSFSVLLAANETRFGVNRALVTLAIPAIMLANALLAPLIGMLATRLSLRLIMVAGGLLTVAGYAVLSVAPSFPFYIMTFALLLGPGFAIAVVLPPTLIMRWFTFNSGRVLGLISMPIIIAAVPLVASWAFQSLGLAGAYRVLVAMAAVAAVSCLFIVDQPPIPARDMEMEASAEPWQGAVAAQVMTLRQLLGRFAYWAMIMPEIAVATGSMVLTAHMVPMIQSWGLSLALAATLLSVQSFVGMFGTVFFGWLADRIGGSMAMLVLIVDSAALWLLLLLHPPFMLLLPLVGLIGFHGAGAVPVLGVMLNRAFGSENFSRAYGLMNFISLPFGVLCVPAAAVVFAATGSYAGAILGVVAFMGLGIALLSAVARRALRVAVA
jgi:MFS family permease